ncbi:MAG: DUF502 domain-containing protein [Sediminibacterium sp.]|jgi:uncharacterized membrane protein|nr:DUF502 domain-containing protein [Sediminibacterium sp.]
MPSVRQQVIRKKILSTVAQLFFQGVVVLAPIGVTIWVVVSLFNWVDNFLPNLLNFIFPLQFAEVNGQIPKVTGLGFVVAITLVLFIGWLSSLFFVERLVSIFDKLLEKTPGIKIIYSSVKDFLEAFAGNKKKFDQPVLVNVDSTDVWRIGFITQKNTEHFGLKDFVTVYVPHSYAISGITYIVSADRIKKMPKGVNASEAMKYVVSGGVTTVDDAEGTSTVNDSGKATITNIGNTNTEA